MMTESMTEYFVATFYAFRPKSQPIEGGDLAALRALKRKLDERAKALNLKGIVVLGPEGLNATVRGLDQEAIQKWIGEAQSILGLSIENTKWSKSVQEPFDRWRIKVKPEIVTLRNLSIEATPSSDPSHLNADSWDEMLQKEGTLVVDTRNDYEVRIGKFKGAIDPKIKKFSDFETYLKKEIKNGTIRPDQNLLLYCTGGIRCEKAVPDAKALGLKNVYQLEGGILKYLEVKRSQGKWEGECFVFDERVAVDTELKASSTYKLCPSCGDPGDQIIECLYCHHESKICLSCKESGYQACSKNCAYHIARLKGANESKVLKPKRLRKVGQVTRRKIMPRLRATDSDTQET